MTHPPLFQKLESQEKTDAENFNLLFDRYGPCLYGTILKAVAGDVFIAEKLTGQVFIEIYRNRYQYDPARQRMVIWMLSVAVKIIKQHGYNYQFRATKEKTAKAGHLKVTNGLMQKL